MPWRPLQSGLGYAICIHPFQASLPDDLPLQIGDQIYIIEQGGNNNEWFRGYLLAPPSLLAGLTSDRGQQLEHRVFTGIFPSNCVEVRELVGENQSHEHQLVAESVGLDGGSGENEVGDEEQQKRKSQALHARRLSRASSRRISARESTRRERKLLVDTTEPVPRDREVPRPSAPVPLLRVGDETGTSADEPLVDEIASCLREWHDARLHEVLLARGYSQIAHVQDLIKRVDTSRKQLLHDVLTAKELRSLREDTVWDLVAGNKMLNEGVIVRSAAESGRILTADDSAIEMTKLQANMSILDRPPKAQADMSLLHHILIDVRNIHFDDETPASLHICLYTKDFGEKPRPLTENYAIGVPLPEIQSDEPINLPKTLFSDLSFTDIGSTGDTSKIFVVFMLVKDEPLRKNLLNNPLPDSLSTSGSRGHGGPKERRSLLGGPKRKDNHKRAGSDNSLRPGSVRSWLSDTDGRQSSQANDTPFSDTKTAKRVIGIGALDLTDVARQSTDMEIPVTLWTSCPLVDDTSSDSTDWSEIIRELASNKSAGFTRVGLMKRLDVFTTAFASADLDVLVRNTPTLLYNVHQTQKLGFSGVPKKKRSDIYLTLAAPFIDQNPCLQHSKFGNVPLQQRCQSNLANLQLTLEVRKANGERVEGCVYTAANHKGHTAWRTTAIERGEEWNQTIKLAIPAEDVPGSHIVMSVADSPNFPFALGWVPLWESGAFVRDGDHQVALYVYDEYSSSIVGGKGAYLSLPPWHKKDLEPAYGSSITVSIRTYLCSTEHSQDPNLLGLLKWREYHGAELISLLERFSFVPEIEVVKLLSGVFNALFEILYEYANHEAYEDIVFYNFAIIMTIARDRRFNIGNVIEQYAKTLHDWPYASQSLLRAFYRLVTNPLDTATSRKLRAALKVGDQMVKLIVEARSSPSEITNGTSHERYEMFEQDLQTFFVAVMALLRNPMPVLLGTQTLIVQHFHSWLPQLSSIMAPTGIVEIATNLLDACGQAQGKMILYRLILIVNFSHLDVFKSADVRVTLIANTFRWLAPYWGRVDEVTDQWRDQVRLCCSIVAAQMAELGDESCQYVPKLVESYSALEKATRIPKKTFSLLFPTTYPFPSKQTQQDVEVDETMLEISAVLAAALTSGERLYFDANEVEITDVLMQSLRVTQSILKGDAFPQSWLSLHVSHHRYTMIALDRISQVLIDCLPDAEEPDTSEAMEFDTQIWRTFFDTLFAVVNSRSLAMETFPEQKRRAVWNIAGDVRELGAALIRRSWTAIGWVTDEDSRAVHGFDNLGGYQVQFVPDLVPPIVELCLSVHASLRSVAIEVLRSMIISTWELDEDLSTIQSAIINCLDKVCRTKQVTNSVLQKTFLDEIVVQFAPLQHSVEDSLYNAVRTMFGKVEELLGMLIVVHQGGNINEANKIMDTLNLMHFFRDVHSDDAYMRHVHQLSELQVGAGNHTEAGLALKLHADRYEWDPSTLLVEIAEPRFPSQTAFERKEILYFEMCKHFETGQAWPLALSAYKELANQYENVTFDHSKLARSQRAMAAIHEQIARGDRAVPRYFRVVFKGLGFSLNLCDKEFIYEGLPTDRQAHFEERIQQMYPSAQIIRTKREPDVEGQFIQVFPVSPNRDLAHVVYQRTKVSPAAREYSLLSSPQKFTTSTRHLHPDVPVTDQVVEKILYTTAESFPNILKRSEIVKVENVTLTQVEAAVERTTRKTQELLALEKRISSGRDDAAMSRLTEDLLLSVDPNSDSSVSRYRNLLPVSEQPDAASEEIDYDELEDKVEPPLDLMQNALKVALLDHVLAIRRCLSLYTRSSHLSTRAELVPRFEATFAHELEILFPGKGGMLDEPSPRPSMVSPEIQVSEPQEVTAVQEEEPIEDRSRRRSRGRSLSFLRRATSSSRRPNGTRDASIDAGPRSGSRHGRTHSRESSLSRRLSWFRSESQSVEGSGRLTKTDSAGKNGVLTSQSSVSIVSLKKRLSSLRIGGTG